MSDEKKRAQRERERCVPQDLKEPKSPGAAVVAVNFPAGGSIHDRALPGESGLPRSEDMSPADHRPVEPSLPEGCEAPQAPEKTKPQK